MMKLECLISTCGSRLADVPALLLAPDPSLGYLVSHQVRSDQRDELPPAQLLREDVRYAATSTTGIAANRNHCLDRACAELSWLLDDDVRLLPEAPALICRFFEQHPETDVACFRIETPQGEPYRAYPVSACRLATIEDVRQVSSIEIVFRTQRVIGRGIRFDERFGLGRPWPCSEEFLFLVACLRAGLRIDYYPLTTVVHPKESTTRRRSQAEPAMLEKSGAVNAVLYGCPGAYLRNLLSVFKAGDLRREVQLSAWEFLRCKNRGTRQALRGTPPAPGAEPAFESHPTSDGTVAGE